MIQDVQNCFRIQRTTYLRKPRFKKWDPRFENPWFLEAISTQDPSFKKNETLRAHVLRHSEKYFVFLIPCVTWGGRGRWVKPERIQNESLSELKHTPERIQNQSLSESTDTSWLFCCSFLHMAAATMKGMRRLRNSDSSVSQILSYPSACTVLAHALKIMHHEVFIWRTQVVFGNNG